MNLSECLSPADVMSAGVFLFNSVILTYGIYVVVSP